MDNVLAMDSYPPSQEPGGLPEDSSRESEPRYRIVFEAVDEARNRRDEGR